MILIMVQAIILFLAAVLHIIMGVMVYTKNPRDKVNIHMGIAALFSGIFTFAYGANYAYILFEYNSLDQVPYLYPYLFFARLTYVGAMMPAPWIMYSLYLKSVKKIKIIGILLYAVGSAVTLLAISTPAMIQSINFKNGFKNGLLESIPGPLAVITRVYFVIGFLIGCYISYSFYRDSTGLKKIQAKYLMIGSLIFALSSIVAAGLLPLLGLRRYTGFAPVSSVFFVGFNAYAIIRHRFLDIETVIHKTLLWLLTSGLILIPMAVLLFFTYNWLNYFSYAAFCLLIMALFFIFLYLYHFIQPKINHWFRRKKYDYQQILLEIGEKLTLEIDIKKATATLLNEVTRLMYLRNGVIFVKNEDDGEYQWYTSIGHTSKQETHTAADMSDTAESAHTSEENIKTEKIKEHYPRVIDFIMNKPEILERQQITFNPEYKEIKDQGEKLFAALDVELIIPLSIEGKILGILGLGKKETLKPFNPKDLEVLQKLGHEAGIALYNALHHESIVEKERMAEELRLGKEIQQQLLPQETPHIEGLKVHGMMLPAKEIGGDYYDYITSASGNQKLAIVIGDVTGKGVGAGLIMATAKATLKGISEQGLTPKQTLVKTNSLLSEYTRHKIFMTMLYLEWDNTIKKLKYCSAGHEHIIVIRKQGNTIETILSGGVLLGMLPDISSLIADHELELHSGDRVVIYTDGITEAKNNTEEMYGLNRLQSSVQNHSQKTLESFVIGIKEDVYQFIGTAQQYDDITMVGMEAE